MPQLVLKILQCETGLTQLRLEGRCRFGVDRLLGLFNERQHVAHAKEPRRHALRVEGFQGVQLLANPDELDRLADHRLDRQRRPAPGIAVQFGENHALDAHRLVEGRRHVDRLLTGHCIDHEKRVAGIGSRLDLHQFLHQRLVDLQPSRRVDDDGVGLMPGRFLESLPADINRVAGALPHHHGHLNLLAEQA